MTVFGGIVVESVQEFTTLGFASHIGAASLNSYHNWIQIAVKCAFGLDGAETVFAMVNCAVLHRLLKIIHELKVEQWLEVGM